MSNPEKKEADKSTISQAFSDNRLPGSYSKPGEYNSSKFDNLLEDEEEIAKIESEPRFKPELHN